MVGLGVKKALDFIIQVTALPLPPLAGYGDAHPHLVHHEESF